MSRLKRELCTFIVYPSYTDWANHKGIMMSQSVFSSEDLESLDGIRQRAILMTKLNRYYGCSIIYAGVAVLNYYNT